MNYIIFPTTSLPLPGANSDVKGKTSHNPTREPDHPQSHFWTYPVGISFSGCSVLDLDDQYRPSRRTSASSLIAGVDHRRPPQPACGPKTQQHPNKQTPSEASRYLLAVSLETVSSFRYLLHQQRRSSLRFQ